MQSVMNQPFGFRATFEWVVFSKKKAIDKM